MTMDLIYLWVTMGFLGWTYMLPDDFRTFSDFWLVYAVLALPCLVGGPFTLLAVMFAFGWRTWKGIR